MRTMKEAFDALDRLKPIEDCGSQVTCAQKINLRCNAIVRRSGPVHPLRRLQMRPFDCDQRGSMARRHAALRAGAAFSLQRLRPSRMYQASL